MVTSTAPSAWRAISPVSSVTSWRPNVNVFLMDFIDVLPVLWGRGRPAVGARAGGRASESENPAGASLRSVAGRRGPAASLLAQAEPLDERAVRLDVAALQVVELA